MRRPVNYGVRIVPEKSVVVIERFGKFHTTLGAGIHLLVPLVDQIAYVWHLKDCLLYTSPSPRDLSTSRMPSSA